MDLAYLIGDVGLIYRIKYNICRCSIVLDHNDNVQIVFPPYNQLILFME